MNPALMIAAALGVATVAGCAPPPAAGVVELFHNGKPSLKNCRAA